jgi:hypothetical protein
LGRGDTLHQELRQSWAHSLSVQTSLMKAQLVFGYIGGPWLFLCTPELQHIVSDDLTSAEVLFWRAHAYLRIRVINSSRWSFKLSEPEE